MNETGISNKKKLTVALSFLFLAMVLCTIYIKIHKTPLQSPKEVSMQYLIKTVESIEINTKALENNKNEYLKKGKDILHTEYQVNSKKLRRENNQLLQLSIENNFEKENILLFSNALDKKLINTNRVVDIKRFLENNLENIYYYDSIGSEQMKIIFLIGNKLNQHGLNFLKNAAQERENYTTRLRWVFVIIAVLYFISFVLTILYFRKSYKGNKGRNPVVKYLTKNELQQEKTTQPGYDIQSSLVINESEVNSLVENMADSFILLDSNWHFTYLNKAALKHYAVLKQEILGKNIWELYPEDANGAFYEAMNNAKTLQQPQSCELYNFKEDKWFINFIHPSENSITVYTNDITTKKKEEIQLNKALKNLTFHINNAPLATLEFDGKMKIVQWSKMAKEIFGWTTEEVMNKGYNFMEHVYVDDVNMVNKALNESSKKVSTNTIINNRNYTKSGKVIHCEWHNSVIRDENNNVTSILCIVKDVTASMATQIELTNTKAIFRGMVEQTIVGVYIRKANKLLYVNQRFGEIFGYTEAELYDDFDWFRLIADEDKNRVRNTMLAYEQNKISSHEYEFNGLHKTGKIIFGKANGAVTKYSDEDAIIGTIIDNSDRKTTGEKLRISNEALILSNERYELIAQATNDGIWDWNMENDILTGNERFCNLFNIIENAGINYEYFKNRIHPDDKERMNANLKNAVANKISILTEEFRFQDKNGSYKIFFDRAYILYKNNKAYRMYGAMQDITAEKESAKKLILEKELSDSVINSLPGIFYLFTRKGQYYRWNKNYETVSGYSAEEMMNMHPLDMFLEDEKELMRKKIENVFVTGNAIIEANFKTKAGKLIPYYFTGMCIKYENEDCVMGVGIDISARRHSQKELVESEQKFRTLVQQASEGIIITDEYGNLNDVNESAGKLMGYSTEELANMTIDDIFIEEAGIMRPFKFNSMLKGTVVISEHSIKRKNGKFINVEISAKQLSDGRYQLIVRDITERTQAEEALRISEKKYRLLFNDNPLPMWISSLNKNVFYDVNKAAFLSYGYTKEEFLKMQLSDLNIDSQAIVTINPNAESDGNSMQEDIWKQKKKDGSIIKVNLINHVFIYEGKPAILTLANDITAKFDAEENLQLSHEALRNLASHLETIRENERSHIAREIHDELGQQLTGLKMDISWLSKKINSEDEAIKEKLKDTITLIDKTVLSVRRIATQLRPSILDDLGLIAAMDWQSEEFEKRSEITSVFNTNVSQVSIHGDIATAIFRIYQESLTNVLRHAQATEVNSFFWLNEGSITLVIEDNGIGFNEKEVVNKKTLGLLGMKERIHLINGTYEITGTGGKGTSVVINVPLK